MTAMPGSMGLLREAEQMLGGSAGRLFADLAGNDEFIGILSLQASDLVGGNIVDELPVAVLEVGEHVVGIVGFVQNDVHIVDVLVESLVPCVLL